MQQVVLIFLLVLDDRVKFTKQRDSGSVNRDILPLRRKSLNGIRSGYIQGEMSKTKDDMVGTKFN